MPSCIMAGFTFYALSALWLLYVIVSVFIFALVLILSLKRKIVLPLIATPRHYVNLFLLLSSPLSTPAPIRSGRRCSRASSGENGPCWRPSRRWRTPSTASASQRRSRSGGGSTSPTAKIRPLSPCPTMSAHWKTQKRWGFFFGFVFMEKCIIKKLFKCTCEHTPTNLEFKIE